MIVVECMTSYPSAFTGHSETQDQEKFLVWGPGRRELTSGATKKSEWFSSGFSINSSGGLDFEESSAAFSARWLWKPTLNQHRKLFANRIIVESGSLTGWKDSE